jgi:hypothetical protein
MRDRDTTSYGQGYLLFYALRRVVSVPAGYYFRPASEHEDLHGHDIFWQVTRHVSQSSTCSDSFLGSFKTLVYDNLPSQAPGNSYFGA